MNKGIGSLGHSNTRAIGGTVSEVRAYATSDEDRTVEFRLDTYRFSVTDPLVAAQLAAFAAQAVMWLSA